MSESVSAVLPVRDGMPYLPAALESLWSQTRPPDEVIVVDDGSQDGTPTFLRDQASKDPRLHLISQPATGLVDALNRGLREASGTWVARLDADDVARPNRLAAQLQFVAENPDIVFVGTDYGFIDKNGQPFSATTHLAMREPGRFDPIVDPNVPHQGVIFRREAVLAMRGYRDLAPAEDLDLWLRLAESHPLGFLDEVLVDVRIRRDGVSTSGFIRQRIMWSYVRACARARRSESPEPQFDEWFASYEVGTARRRRWKAQYSMRLAAAAWTEGRHLQAAGKAAAAMYQHPQSVIAKVRRLRRRR